jgi:CRP-like cAMP-binding protein
MHHPAELQPERSRLIRKLQSVADLSPDEQRAVFSLPMVVKTMAADQDIIRVGDRPSDCCLVVEGFVCRYDLMSEGKRQILSFHISGDIPDLQSLFLEVMDHSLCTLTPCKLAFVPHDSLRALLRAHPGLAAAFWRDTLIEAAVSREWMVGLGHRAADQRAAHLLCEMLVRLKAVGEAREHAYELPLTQAELGDALGLSIAHVNRTLQDLRAGGLIELRRGTLAILDWDGLKRLAEFDPTYLHLRDKAVAA